MFIIYQITNKVNGKRYIGKTGRTIEKRFKEHIYASMYDESKLSVYFLKAIRKHGANSFEIKEIDRTEDKDVACYLEMFWITSLKTFVPKYGYNTTFGGDGGSPTQEVREKISFVKRVLRPLSEESRAKIAAANAARVWSEESRKKISIGNLGKKHSEESKRKVGIANLGRPRPDLVGRVVSVETRTKLSAANYRRWAAKRNQSLSQPVISDV